jgi:hypothetical protein
LTKKKTDRKSSKAKEGDPRLNNKFWMLRSKHGRDRIFKTPELMWQSACEYFQWCDDNPLMEAVLHQKTATLINVPKMRPYTKQGLCHYLDCNVTYFKDFKENIGKKEKDFSLIITHIGEVIYRQKFEGASAGFLNPNIIARDLGLSDKHELEQTITGIEVVIKGK